MLPSIAQLRRLIALAIVDLSEQGHHVRGLDAQFGAVPDSYDALAAFAAGLDAVPMRDDWPWHEPSDLAGIRAASAPGRPGALPSPADPHRIRTAWEARIAGCILGKPFEFEPTLDELRDALQPAGAWPLTDYLSIADATRLRIRHPQLPEAARETITYAAPDDDLNYTILAMLVLERHGGAFTATHLRDAWLRHLPPAVTFGPERTLLVRSAMESLDGGETAAPETWAAGLNPRNEWCGALIRADAYGYACPGDPERATELAWRDAAFTHRRTGIYGALFVAAALALAPVVRSALDVFAGAVLFVPQESRFAAAVREAIGIVAGAADWETAYRAIHARWPEHGHCRIFQETATLVNSLHFADDAGEAICLQVMQGNDTDSFGATAGSLAAMLFGAGSLPRRWTAPFNDDIRTALALFHERSITALGDRLAALPAIVRGDVPPSTSLPY